MTFSSEGARLFQGDSFKGKTIPGEIRVLENLEVKSATCGIASPCVPETLLRTSLDASALGLQYLLPVIAQVQADVACHPEKSKHAGPLLLTQEGGPTWVPVLWGHLQFKQGPLSDSGHLTFTQMNVFLQGFACLVALSHHPFKTLLPHWQNYFLL